MLAKGPQLSRCLSNCMSFLPSIYLCDIVACNFSLDFSSIFDLYREYELYNKSGFKRLNTLGHLDQYTAQHGLIVKQSYCETVLVTILFNSN